MSADQRSRKIAEELLPCHHTSDRCHTAEHGNSCPARFREAVASALTAERQAAEEAGYGQALKQCPADSEATRKWVQSGTAGLEHFALARLLAWERAEALAMRATAKIHAKDELLNQRAALLAEVEKHVPQTDVSDQLYCECGNWDETQELTWADHIRQALKAVTNTEQNQACGE